MRQLAVVCSYHLRVCILLSALWVLLGACAETTETTMVDRTAWIQVGKTTKPEVIAQYGDADMVLIEEGGETATYRPSAAQRVSPPIQVPTVQAGPLGASTTQTQTIEPGLGKRDPTSRRPQKEIRIRYDAQGIVQEVLQ